MTCHSFLIATLVSLSLVLFFTRPSVLASPLSSYQPVVVVGPRMVQPYFPDTPPSCPICAKGYPSISSCAQAAPALANSSAVRVCRSLRSLFLTPLQSKGHFQPGCVHRRDQVLMHGRLSIRVSSVCRLVCVPPPPALLIPLSKLSIAHGCRRTKSFEKTNQTAVLNTPNLPSLVNSIRQVCAVASTLLGNVSNTDGETTPSVASTPVASSTSSTASARDLLDSTLLCVITGIAALITFPGASLQLC
jgi:hypothetical protein